MTTWRAAARQRHAAGKPAVFTIPADVPFVDALARGILDDAADPLALAAMTVLLPTRRACRSLREAFLRLSEGKPLLLPRLVPLNDLDDEEALFASYSVAESVMDIPPPIAALKRELMLTRLILSLPPDLGEPLPEQALRLARELAKFLDQVQTEQVSFANLKNLVPEAYAKHWQETLRFMTILTENWPLILRAESAVDPAEHRNRVFAAQAEAWAKGGSSGPIIAAGSTGSIPATAHLLKVIAHLAEGCVVLPGLDMALETEGWDAIDETHPQHGLKHLLGTIGIARDIVQPWPGTTLPASTRARFLAEVMRPAATSHVWQALKAFDASSVTGLARLDCATPREEAEAISLVMRETLERPGRTCALVTPDRDLAQRVTAELKRWSIDVDDSAGRPLHQTPPGAFLRLTAEMVAENFAPVPLLAACNHPFAAAGLDAAVFRTLTRLTEREILRGPRPPAGLEGLAQLIGTAHHKRDLSPWLKHLTACWSDFAALMTQAEPVPLSVLLKAHMEAAEAFAATHDTAGPLHLWDEDTGDAAAGFIADLAQCADTLPPILPAAYPALFQALMDGRVVRPRFGKHPRLHILGPLEARLQHFDVLILGGLNEGTWPAAAQPDPWMSRPMRKDFGLPLPERRIGQAAHDIVQALSGPRVVMTRAKKVEGTPTVPSRWLMRLAQVVKSARLEDSFETAPTLAWTGALTRPERFALVAPPAPRPPLAARPRKLSVTQVETWMRDPYGVYARHILKLRALDPLEQDVSAADYGTLIHQSLDEFISAHPSGDLPANALESLIAIGRAAFTDVAPRPGVMAFWWPRFERIAAWFIDYEQQRRPTLAHAYVEQTGEMTLKAPGGPFTVSATADRIDRSKDGSLTIIDYKTGAPPRETEVIAGFAPQLPLEAAILAAGGFKTIPAGDVAALSFWHLHGRAEGGNERIIKASASALAADAHQGLSELVAKFDDPTTPYEARPNPAHAPKYSDYEHLARVKEWSAAEDEGDA